MLGDQRAYPERNTCGRPSESSKLLAAVVYFGMCIGSQEAPPQVLLQVETVCRTGCRVMRKFDLAAGGVSISDYQVRA